MPEPSETGPAWASVARETFEHSIVPWAGRTYAEWMRTWARPHPGDPRGLVQVPEDVYRAFQQRIPGKRLTRQTSPGCERVGPSRLPKQPVMNVTVRDQNAWPMLK